MVNNDVAWSEVGLVVEVARPAARVVDGVGEADGVVVNLRDHDIKVDVHEDVAVVARSIASHVETSVVVVHPVGVDVHLLVKGSIEAVHAIGETGKVALFAAHVVVSGPRSVPCGHGRVGHDLDHGPIEVVILAHDKFRTFDEPRNSVTAGVVRLGRAGHDHPVDGRLRGVEH